jgi:hypothetical protein
MNCQNHPEIPAVAYCRTCGKPVCEQCRRTAYGTMFCDEHVPAATLAGPPPPPPPPIAAPGSYEACNCSPGVALALGLTIPGVGAIYNGQYAKGLVHAVVFGLITSILSSDAGGGLEPLFGLLLAAWIFYMGFEAYHTAWKRRRGEPVDEFSSLVDVHGRAGSFPVAGVALIVAGAVLLLNTLNLLDLRATLRYWPVSLIVFGAYLLYARMSGPGDSETEVRHGR